MTAIRTRDPELAVASGWRLPSRMPALDGIRGLAVLTVVAHNTAMFDPDQGSASLHAAHLMHLGWSGVQLFFVLSGFLITRILLETRPAPNYYRSFYARRALRIFPLYYATLAFLFVLLPLVGWFPTAQLGEDRALSKQIWLWLYLSNWTAALGLGGGQLFHFWSLAVEEQFYLVWPVVVRHGSVQRLLWVCAGVIVAAPVIRVGLILLGVPPVAIYIFTVSRMDALAFGAMAAALMHRPETARRVLARRRVLWPAAIASALGGWVATQGDPQLTEASQTFGYSVLAAAFMFAVLAAACGGAAPPSAARRMLCSAPLRGLGKYSYAMYVFHVPIHEFAAKPWLARHRDIAHLGFWAAAAYTVVLIAASFIAAWVSYRLIERPFLRMRSRYAALPAPPPRQDGARHT